MSAQAAVARPSAVAARAAGWRLEFVALAAIWGSSFLCIKVLGANWAPLQVAFGRMPVSESLPYEWYETPNVHHCTITDFEDLCRKIGIRIRERLVLHEGKAVTALPNLLGSLAVYRCTSP